MSSSGQLRQASKGKGRQKVEMKKMENSRSREVTFSKRKGGFLKKASELSTLSGAEVVAVVFSPSGKPYSYGHPNLYATTNKFIGRDVFPTGEGQSSGAAQGHMNVNQEKLNQLNQLEIMLEAERKLKKELDRDSHEIDFSKLDYEQLEMCLDVVKNFQHDFQAAQVGLHAADNEREHLQNEVFASPTATAPPLSLSHGSGSSSAFVVGSAPHSSMLTNPHAPNVGSSNFSVPYGLGGHMGWNHSDAAASGTLFFTPPNTNAMLLPHGSSVSSFGSEGGPSHCIFHLATPNDQWAGWPAVPYGFGGHIGPGMISGSSGSNLNGFGGDRPATTSNHAKSTVPSSSDGHIGLGISSGASGSNVNGSGTSSVGGGGDGSATKSNHSRPFWFR